MNAVRPFLKWAGNKYHCIQKIKPWLMEKNRLIEPFTGSGAIFVNTNYPGYLLSEKNPDIIALFRHLMREGLPFIEECQLLFQQKTNQKFFYLDKRAEFNASTDWRRRAILFLYLNRHGFNGLCRYNQNGGYNVPFGRYKKPYFPYNEMLFFFQKCQQHEMELNCLDFKECMKLAKKGDIIYCDPPYAPLSSSANFSTYTGQKFSLATQLELANIASELANNDIPVIISNHDTPFTRELYKEAQLISFQVQRFISCNGKSRLPVQELIAIYA